MIIFAEGHLGLNLLKFIKTKHPKVLKRLILVENIKTNKLNIFAKRNFKGKILYWKNYSKNKLIKNLKKTNSELIFLVWWPYILDKKFLKLKKNIINTHPSYLPYFKGKDPNFWSILNGGPYGVSINHVNEKIDSGPIAFQAKIANVDWTWDAKKLYQESLKHMLKLIKQNFNKIAKCKLPKINQNIKYAKINYRKEMIKKSRIKLNSKIILKDFLNLLRAKTFYPHEGLTFLYKKKKFSININIKKVSS